MLFINGTPVVNRIQRMRKQQNPGGQSCLGWKRKTGYLFTDRPRKTTEGGKSHRCEQTQIQLEKVETRGSLPVKCRCRDVELKYLTLRRKGRGLAGRKEGCSAGMKANEATQKVSREETRVRQSSLKVVASAKKRGNEGGAFWLKQLF